MSTQSRPFHQSPWQHLSGNLLWSLGLALWVFLIPSNLFWKWAEVTGYVHGLFLEYVIPKIYLTDLVMAGLVVGWLVVGGWQASLIPAAGQKYRLPNPSKWSTPEKLVVSSWGCLVVFQVFLGTPNRWWWLAAVTTVGLFGWWLMRHRWLLQAPVVITSWVAALLFQTLLSGYQFVTQRSLAGYWLLGEPNLSTPFGLAKSNWWGREVILPYGTSPHPNILAGWAVISWWCLWRLTATAPGRSQFWIRLAVTLLVLSIVGLTQSVSACLALGMGWLIVSRPKLSTSWLLTLAAGFFVGTPLALMGLSAEGFQSASITHRVALQTQAVSLWLETAILGVGWHQFGVQLAEQTLPGSLQHFIQPVHHLGLLWLAEFGVLGVIALGSLGWFIATTASTQQRRQLAQLCLLLSPIAAFDHYLLTQHLGWLLVVVLLVCLPGFGAEGKKPAVQVK